MKPVFFSGLKGTCRMHQESCISAHFVSKEKLKGGRSTNSLNHSECWCTYKDTNFTVCFQEPWSSACSCNFFFFFAGVCSCACVCMHGYKSSVLCIQLCTSLCQQLLRCHHRILPPHLPCLLTLLAWITQLIPSSPLSLNATVKNALSLPFTGIAGFVFGSCLVTLSPSFCWASWDTEQKCWCCLTLHSRGTCQIKCCVSSGVWMQTYRKADESVLECYGESRSGLKWGFFFFDKRGVRNEEEGISFQCKLYQLKRKFILSWMLVVSLSLSASLASWQRAGLHSGLQGCLCIPALLWEYGLQWLQSEGLIHTEHNDPVWAAKFFTHAVWLALYSASIYSIHNALSPMCLAWISAARCFSSAVESIDGDKQRVI